MKKKIENIESYEIVAFHIEGLTFDREKIKGTSKKEFPVEDIACYAGIVLLKGGDYFIRDAWGEGWWRYIYPNITKEDVLNSEDPIFLRSVSD